jgi:hypothetical protein
MTWVRTAAKELLSLIVDDGFLAVMSLVAIGVTYLATRERALGPTDTAGWLLMVLIALGILLSVRRGVRNH